MRIYLIGYMYSGKTTLGHKLAAKLGYQWLDLDQTFECVFHTSIPIFFKRYGEEAFRKLEQKQLHATADIDNTVKPIYGHQEGAGLGYNPMKPGRPSHNYHSFFIGRARISLGVEVLPGKQHSGRCGMKRLWSLIDSLPPHLWTKRRAGQSSSAALFAESCFPTPH